MSKTRNTITLTEQEAADAFHAAQIAACIRNAQLEGNAKDWFKSQDLCLPNLRDERDAHYRLEERLRSILLKKFNRILPRKSASE